MIRDITIDPFDLGSVKKAIREVEYVRDKLLPAMKYLIETLIKQGEEIARAELLAFDKPAYDTGALYDSIGSGMVDDETGVVTTGVTYAVHVEYGTGFYALNGKGRKGGWSYFDTRLGRFRYTEGMRPRRFMYETFRKLEDISERTGGRLIVEYLG